MHKLMEYSFLKKFIQFSNEQVSTSSLINEFMESSLMNEFMESSLMYEFMKRSSAKTLLVWETTLYEINKTTNHFQVSIPNATLEQQII